MEVKISIKFLSLIFDVRDCLKIYWANYDVIKKCEICTGMAFAYHMQLQDPKGYVFSEI